MSITFLFMIAVVQISGHQYTLTEKMTIVVDNQNLDAGKTIEVEALLLASEDGKTTTVGVPTVAGSKVKLTVVENFKEEKVRVFKIKAKKRYTRTYGFRAMKTRLLVESIA
jgi:large subunit ribosomal protein L21